VECGGRTSLVLRLRGRLGGSRRRSVSRCEWIGGGREITEERVDV
jgi:hypothetical protein